MLFYVLTLVQDADHVEPICVLPDIDHVRASPGLASSRAQIHRAAGHLPCGQSQTDSVQLVEIAIGLVKAARWTAVLAPPERLPINLQPVYRPVTGFMTPDGGGRGISRGLWESGGQTSQTAT